MLKLLDRLTSRFGAPPITGTRILLAILVAVAADGLQIPLAVPPAPEILDVIAAILTVWLLGFHPLLLPTFIVEFIPIIDMLPTWTGCVIAVIALRKRAQRETPSLQEDEPLDEKPLPEKMARRTDSNL